MAGRAGCRSEAVIVVDVAIQAYAWRFRVRIRQRESNRVMVESSWLPGARGVALLAGLREASSDVVGVFRGLVICQVTAYAGRGRQAVVVVDVAIGAHPWRIRVRIGQRKSGGCVVEFGVQPGVRAMALFAIR